MKKIKEMTAEEIRDWLNNRPWDSGFQSDLVAFARYVGVLKEEKDG